MILSDKSSCRGRPSYIGDYMRYDIFWGNCFTLFHYQSHKSSNAHLCEQLYLHRWTTGRDQRHKVVMGDVTLSNNFGSSDKLPRIKEPDNHRKEFNTSKKESDNDAVSQVGIIQ